MGAILGCANKLEDKCWDIKIINNVAGGVEPSTVDAPAYSVMGDECGNYKEAAF